MAEVTNELIYEVLKKLQTDVAGLKDRMDRLDERMLNLEKRQTASTHFEQAVIAHLAAIHDSIDGLRGQMLGMDRRVAAVEAR